MEEEEYNPIMEQAVAQGQASQNAMQSAAAQYYMQEQEKGMIDVQLEVDTIKSDILHLLRQDVLKGDKDNPDKVSWQPMDNQEKRTFTDEGVEKIMQSVHFIVNKNTLLTNLDEDEINYLMLRFITEVNDLVLLKYQIIFRQPSFEECKKIIKAKIENKKKLQIFAMEILGKDYNEKEIEGKLLLEIEKGLEKEINKVKGEQIKERIREYGVLIQQLEAIVFCTLNRAWKGEERGSIRRHSTISEIIGAKPPMMKQRGGVFSWRGR